MCEARAGISTLDTIAQMAFGTGGVDSSGEPVDHADTDTELNKQVIVKDIDGYEVLSDTKIRYTCTIAAGDLPAGTELSEVALIDSAGDVVAFKSFYPKGIDADLDTEFQCDDTF